jgi:glycosyltransferase involved in cell wall biosynthesis
MAAFRMKMERGLRSRGIEVSNDPRQAADALLLIGGTRHLGAILRARRNGTRIVHRLDGLNWLQRARWTGLRYHLRAEYGNALMRLLRSRAAHRVIYQSQFIREWWHKWYGPARVPEHVILNGVDLEEFSPQDAVRGEAKRRRALVVEGSLAGGQNAGLFHAVRLAEALSAAGLTELVVAGRVDARSRKQAQQASKVPVQFLDVVPRSDIPALMRSADLLFPAEVNPPCPNSVMEALACGLPVAGFDTGALGEIVTSEAGRLTPYGGDPWKLEPPDVPALSRAAEDILREPDHFRRGARRRAEEALGLDKMIDAYLGVLLR